MTSFAARFLLALIAVLPISGALRADTAPFDLPGPALRISITHQGQTLPIGEVPQLAVGDSISVITEFPDDQSAHYVLVAAFLRGATNPPPDKWFFQSETWKKAGNKGLTLTVPDGAQQIALFLAPETGGDVATLRNAVKGRPGAFVRAAQDLAQASLDHARLTTYLSSIRKIEPGDPGRLGRITPLLARSLQLKIDQDCLTKLPELQAPCLLQNQESLVLSDGHSNAISEAMQGPGTDLALQLSATPQGGLGYYSPYIAAIRDIVGIFSSLHTAKYQYIPALATLDGDRMGLVLNTPPSFHNPKSVLVTALPVVAPVHVPPLQTVDATPVLCLHGTDLFLPVSGAPLIFATHYAHDISLRVSLPGGQTVDLPATADAERGGLIIQSNKIAADLTAPAGSKLHGTWGFQPFDGPKIDVQTPQPGHWRMLQGATRATTITLSGGSAACVTNVAIAGQSLAWKATAPDTLTVTLPSKVEKAALALDISDATGRQPDREVIPAAPEPFRFDAEIINRSVQQSPAPAALAITLDADGAIPSDALLGFSLRSKGGESFSGDEVIEIAADGGGGTAILSQGKGLTLADAHVAIASITPSTALGPSAYGPLRARVVRDNAPGDWILIGTLVRLPSLASLQCPSDPTASCNLSGSRLFLVSSVSSTRDFAQPILVPEGFTGSIIQLPHPQAKQLYLRLHDAPQITAQVTF
jgi:hypothetical protein